jgi:general secretion pathway protein J
MSRRAHPRHHAFTLVELLVAISILAIVAVLGWRGLDGIIRARQTLTEQMETTRGMQLAFAQMQSDAERIVTRDVVGARAFLQVGGDRFTLVRQVFNDNQPARLQVVSYRVVNGTLVRRESQPTRDLQQLDGLWQAAISDADTSGTVAIETGVASMQVATWVNSAWRQAGVDPNANTGATASTSATLLAQQNPNLAAAAQSSEPTGLQVALQVQNQQAPMIKSFLLVP